MWRLLAIISLLLAKPLAATSQAPRFGSEIRPLLNEFCFDCHEGDQAEAEIDLAKFQSLASLRSRPKLWQRIDKMLRSRQMPPPDAPQPSEAQWQTLTTWIGDFLRRPGRPSMRVIQAP